MKGEDYIYRERDEENAYHGVSEVFEKRSQKVFFLLFSHFVCAELASRGERLRRGKPAPIFVVQFVFPQVFLLNYMTPEWKI